LNEYCRRTLEDSVAGTEPENPGKPGGGWLETVRGFLGEELIGVVLFGSAARGEQREGSDVDLLIVLQPSTPLNRKLYRRWDEAIPEPFLSPHFTHLPAHVEQAGSIWLEAAVEGSVLSDRGSRINRFLRRLREEMASGRLVRKSAYGHPYWVRKTEEAVDAQR
jgi:hypothetical protein